MSYVRIIYQDEDGNDVPDEGADGADVLMEEEDDPANNLKYTDSIEEGNEANSCSPTFEDENGAEESSPAAEDSKKPFLVLADAEKWTNQETNCLLKKYNKYILHTGNNKRIRTKKEMWRRIAAELQSEIKSRKSDSQCENRYKSVLRKWRKNATSKHPIKLETPTGGHISKIVPFNVVSTPVITPRNASIKFAGEEGRLVLSDSDDGTKDLVKTMWEIFQKKEEGRVKRHAEKMELLRSLFDTI